MTGERVREMSARYESGETAPTLAAEYGLSAGRVRLLARRVREGKTVAWGGSRPHRPAWSPVLQAAVRRDQQAGLTLSESAARLGWSVRTVARYRARAKVQEEGDGPGQSRR